MLEEEVDVILTGATGIVGSHILYELLHEKLTGKHTGRIVVLARANKSLTAQQRVNNIFLGHCLPDYLWDINIDRLLSCIEVIETDISQPNLESVFSKVPPLNNAHVIHSAASTNLAGNENAYEENYKINYQGTLSLYNATKSFITKFIYISTAFACGIRTGIIENDFHNSVPVKFRNPYEEIKFKTEKILIQNLEKDKINFQILRPGVVVGRLINKPLYFLPRYNVIYAFAAFFNSLSMRKISSPINIHVHKKAQLHLVSVDYVSKVIVQLFKNNSVTQLNIIPQNGCGINEIATLLDVVGYKNYEFVENVVSGRDKIESVYQSKVANSFGPYISNDYYEFDNAQLTELMMPVKMPDVKLNFKELVSYAKMQSFKKYTLFSSK